MPTVVGARPQFIKAAGGIPRLRGQRERLQKEDYICDAHWVTLRDEAEWVERGFNVLVGADSAQISRVAPIIWGKDSLIATTSTIRGNAATKMASDHCTRF